MRKNTDQLLADLTEKLVHDGIEVGALQYLVAFGFQPWGRVFLWLY